MQRPPNNKRPIILKEYWRWNQEKTRMNDSSASSMHFPMSISQIELLNGSNFKKWKSDIELNLGVLDYDHVMKEDPQEALPATASKESKEKYEKWYKHNKMALIMIKKSITENVIGGIPDSEFAKVFFNSIAEK